MGPWLRLFGGRATLVVVLMAAFLLGVFVQRGTTIWGASSDQSAGPGRVWGPWGLGRGPRFFGGFCPHFWGGGGGSGSVYGNPEDQDDNGSSKTLPRPGSATGDGSSAFPVTVAPVSDSGSGSNAVSGLDSAAAAPSNSDSVRVNPGTGEKPSSLADSANDARYARSAGPGGFGGGCCARRFDVGAAGPSARGQNSGPSGQNSLDIEAIKNDALQYFEKHYGDTSGLVVNVTDYGCHIQVDILKNGTVVKSLGYAGPDRFYEVF